MRIVERLLYGIGGLLALILLFIMLCHFKPELAEKIGGILKMTKVGAYFVREMEESEARGRAEGRADYAMKTKP